MIVSLQKSTQSTLEEWLRPWSSDHWHVSRKGLLQPTVNSCKNWNVMEVLMYQHEMRHITLLSETQMLISRKWGSAVQSVNRAFLYDPNPDTGPMTAFCWQEWHGICMLRASCIQTQILRGKLHGLDRQTTFELPYCLLLPSTLPSPLDYSPSQFIGCAINPMLNYLSYWCSSTPFLLKHERLGKRFCIHIISSSPWYSMPRNLRKCKIKLDVSLLSRHVPEKGGESFWCCNFAILPFLLSQ